MKRVKKLLAALLVAVLLVCFAPMSGFDFFAEAAKTTYKTGDIIEFGSYPQSKVTDSATISKLNGVTKKWISYGYYSGTGDWFDGNMAPSDYMKYCDITLNGNKYRAVKFSAYRPYFTGFTANTATDNTYQDDNGYYINNVYYFKYEPLKWRVLDASAGFVACDSAIDSQAYNNYVIGPGFDSIHYGDSNKENYASDWEHSSLRAWLNDDFLNTAFTSTQQSKIKTVMRENKSFINSRYDGNPTADKLTLLSYWDILNTSYGFGGDEYLYDRARIKQSTDYAQCQGCYCMDSNWWLRSPVDFSQVNTVGGDSWANYIDYANFVGAVVPAFNFINLSNLHAADAASVKTTADKKIDETKQTTTLVEQTEATKQSTTLFEQTDVAEQVTTLADKTAEAEQSIDNGKKKTIIISAVSLCLIAAIVVIVICIIKKSKFKK